jgi:hypothetical protein
MRLEFNGATWLTMANLPSITTCNYQVKVGCLTADDPSAQGYFYHWRVISRTTPSTVLPAPNGGLSSTITSQLQALENRADALCVPKITSEPSQLTIQQLRSAAGRVTLDSLWKRAYLGKTTAFDTMVTDLNTNVFDPLHMVFCWIIPEWKYLPTMGGMEYVMALWEPTKSLLMEMFNGSPAPNSSMDMFGLPQIVVEME